MLRDWRTLIEVLTDMRNAVRNNDSLSVSEKEDLIESICNESVYGVDLWEKSPIARIARINMYLHGMVAVAFYCRRRTRQENGGRQIRRSGSEA